jgi:hypothetical protein
MRNIKYFLISGLILICLRSSSQDSARVNHYKPNSIYIEVLGSSYFLYNITYDRIIYHKNNLGVTTGLGIQAIPSGWGMVASFSTQANLIIGHIHYFETGIGFTYYIGNEYCAPIRIGYRFQRDKGGLFFKAAFTPVIQKAYFMDWDNEHVRIRPWGGIAIGVSF